jgi:hypothetical protein
VVDRPLSCCLDVRKILDRSHPTLWLTPYPIAFTIEATCGSKRRESPRDEKVPHHNLVLEQLVSNGMAIERVRLW